MQYDRISSNQGCFSKINRGIDLLNTFGVCLHKSNKQDTNYIEKNLCSNETNKVDPEIQKLLEVYDTIFMKHEWDID